MDDVIVESALAAGAGAYSIAHIVEGALYLYQCPVEPMIPVYALLLGFGLLLMLVLVLIAQRDCCSETEKEVLGVLIGVDAMFLLCWIIASHKWIYSVYEPDYTNSTSSQYCHKTVYMWAFGNTVALDVLLVLVLLCGGCYCLCEMEDPQRRRLLRS